MSGGVGADERRCVCRGGRGAVFVIPADGGPIGENTW